MLDRSGEDRVRADVREAGRSLVVRDPARPSSGDERPLADFLTQLIACERRLPPYRAARREEPEAAAGAYGRARRGAETCLDLSV